MPNPSTQSGFSINAYSFRNTVLVRVIRPLDLCQPPDIFKRFAGIFIQITCTVAERPSPVQETQLS